MSAKVKRPCSRAFPGFEFSPSYRQQQSRVNHVLNPAQGLLGHLIVSRYQFACGSLVVEELRQTAFVKLNRPRRTHIDDVIFDNQLFRAEDRDAEMIQVRRVRDLPDDVSANNNLAEKIRQICQELRSRN